MAQLSTEHVAQRTFNLGLLNDRQFQEVWSLLGSRNVTADDFLQQCVRREFMTNYQVERVLQGERTGFFFGDYKVLYLVGTGSFARVYRAVHRETDKVVAVKVLRRRFSDIPAQYEQFAREGELGCTLRHPNIVPIYEVHSGQGMHFLVMEFVEGRNLREFVKVRKKVDSAEATRIMVEIAAGLDYAFERGLHHRDLKMSNVLISARGRTKLVDFGLAGINEAANADSIPDVDLPNTRTIDYAALERATGVRRDDARSDIYFMGCIYYNMLIGKPALVETRDRTYRLSKSRFEEVVPVRQSDPTLPHCVSLVVNRAMAFDPDLRYQTPGQMVKDLKLAAKRIEDGEVEEEEGPDHKAVVVRQQPKHPNQPTVMVVEADVEMQNVLRSGFKKAGYRVLVTGDPGRAAAQFYQKPDVADCILFNAQQLGEKALEAFNLFGKNTETANLPALLLLDEGQRSWLDRAETSDNRIALFMPLTMKQLRDALASLLAD